MFAGLGTSPDSRRLNETEQKLQSRHGPAFDPEKEVLMRIRVGVFSLCKNCRLTAFMWDFAEIPKEKLPVIKTKLDTLALKPVEEAYNKVPMSQRLDIAGEVYSVLGQDETFWCKFYRVKGYHYEAEKRE